MEKILGGYAAGLYAIMRIVVGLLFACHGAQKLFGVFGREAVPLFSLVGLAGVIEFAGGLLIAVGFLAAYAAFVASGEMAFAYFMAHFPKVLVADRKWGRTGGVLLLRLPVHGKQRGGRIQHRCGPWRKNVAASLGRRPESRERK